MSIHQKIDTDHYYSAAERKKRAARSRIYADIRACLIAIVFILAMLTLALIFYSELMAQGEGYRNQKPQPEVNIAGHIREYPEHCGKLEFKSVEAAKKLGC